MVCKKINNYKGGSIMRKIKKVISLSIVSAIMAASLDVANVSATNISQNEEVEILKTEMVQSQNSDFEIVDGVLKKYYGEGGDVVIPDSVTSIANWAFKGCSSLTSITIPDSVSSIGQSAFEGCSSLTNIEVGKNNIKYSSIDGVLYNKNVDTLTCCPGGKTSINIPDSVSSIGNLAFYGCSSLTNITIPDSVFFIYYGAFRGCSSLTSITIPDSVSSIGEEAFEGCSSLTILCNKGSSAEVYARDNDLPYKDINDASAEATPSTTPTAEPTEIPTPSTTIPSTAPTAEPAETPTPSTTIPSTAHTTVPTALPTPVAKKTQTITAKSIKKSYGAKAFSIAAKTDGDGKLTYSSGNKKVATVSASGKVIIKGCGKTTITIKVAETAAYKSAEKKITLTVVPKKQKVSYAKSTKAKTITVKWRKDSKATGYILQYSRDKKFKKNVKSITISKNKTTSKKITKLTAGKKYYVRVCSYKKVSKHKLKGSYSAVKTVRVKKVR